MPPLAAQHSRELVFEMNEAKLFFGDGIESDRLRFAWAREALVAARTRG